MLPIITDKEFYTLCIILRDNPVLMYKNIKFIKIILKEKEFINNINSSLIEYLNKILSGEPYSILLEKEQELPFKFKVIENNPSNFIEYIKKIYKEWKVKYAVLNNIPIDNILKDITVLNEDLNNTDKEYKLEEKVFSEITGECYTTGFSKLDKIIEGFFTGRLYVLVAPSGMGKSTILRNIAYNLAKQDLKILFITTEMSAVEILTYFLKYHNPDISLQVLMNNKTEINKAINNTPDFIKNNIKVKEMIQEPNIELLKIYLEQNKFNAIIIDYGDLFAPTSDWNRIEEVYSEFKRLAKKYNIPIIVASQSNRDALRDYAGKTQIFHIANSWGKVKVADVVLALQQTTPDRKLNKFKLAIVKNRFGVNMVEIPFRFDLNNYFIKQIE